MKIKIRARSLKITDPVRRHIHRRAAFALGRLAHQIHTVQVTLEDINGPRGGVDKRCAVRVVMGGATPIVIEEHHHELTAAIDGALGRAGRAMARQVDRAQKASGWPQRRLAPAV